MAPDPQNSGSTTEELARWVQVSGGTLVIRMMPLVGLLSPEPLSHASYSMPDPRSRPKQDPSSIVVPSSATFVIRIWPGLSVLTTSTT